MFPSILSAFTLMLTLLLQETLMAALPLPWREIPLILIVCLVIMHRVSLELGVAFFGAATVLAWASGMTGWETLPIGLVTMASAVFFSTRVFARRSLPAFFGFTLGTCATYEILHTMSKFIRGTKISVIEELFLVAIASALALLLSLLVEAMRRNFGRRFVRKETTYEVRQSA